MNVSTIPTRAPITIRRKHWGEGWRLERVFRRSLSQLCHEVYTPEQLDVLLATNNPRSYNDHFTLVATMQREIVGFCALWGRTLQAMYVDPDYTGRGIGRQLLVAMENHARDRRIRALKVNSSIYAEGFYRACGYRVTSRGETTYTSYSHVSIPIISLEKSLREYFR